MAAETKLIQEAIAQALRTAADKIRAKRESSKKWNSYSFYDTAEDRARHSAVNEAIENALDEVASGLEDAADDLVS